MSAQHDLVLCRQANDLVRATAGTVQQDSGDTSQPTIGESFEVELQIRAAAIELMRGGNRMARTHGLERPGRVLLLGVSQPGWFFDSLTISGRLAPGTVATLAAERAERETRECFGDP